MSSHTPSELKNYLALLCMDSIGPKKFYALVKAFPSLDEIFSASSSLLEKLHFSEENIKQLRSPPWETVDKIIVWLEKNTHSIVTWKEKEYPRLLQQIVCPPPILFLQGCRTLMHEAQIAIVGSRNPSPQGKENAYQFAYHLAEKGLTITSGLALGIDGASHRGALDAKGKTIAVLGTGIDTIYPRSHLKLAQEISESGLLISEYPLGVKALAKNFPRRNRIISGLSLGVLVVEAALGSGSLITARYALEQNREIFAIPGSIHHPLARGCHALLREGATLVETAQDILDELKGYTPFSSEDAIRFTPSLPLHFSDPDYTLLLNAMDFSPASIDILVNRTGLTAAQVSSMLLSLELNGQVFSVAGGYLKSV